MPQIAQQDYLRHNLAKYAFVRGDYGADYNLIGVLQQAFENETLFDVIIKFEDKPTDELILSRISHYNYNGDEFYVSDGHTVTSNGLTAKQAFAVGECLDCLATIDEQSVVMGEVAFASLGRNERLVISFGLQEDIFIISPDGHKIGCKFNDDYSVLLEVWETDEPGEGIVCYRWSDLAGVNAEILPEP